MPVIRTVVADTYNAQPRTDPLRALAACLRAWLPDSAVVCHARAGDGYLIPLADRVLVDGAAHQRRTEFIAARWCAHQALRQMQVAAASLPIGQLGQPLWPDGVIGSITHELGNCLVLVMRQQSAAGVGVDLASLEHAHQLRESGDLFMAPGESRQAWGGVDSAVSMLRHFSAKEAVVKATSAMLGRLIDPREICVDFSGGRFSARVGKQMAGLSGRWSVCGGMVMSYAQLPRC